MYISLFIYENINFVIYILGNSNHHYYLLSSIITLDAIYEEEIEKYEQEDMQEYTDKEVQK
jgi:hypothetical protein